MGMDSGDRLTATTASSRGATDRRVATGTLSVRAGMSQNGRYPKRRVGEAFPEGGRQQEEGKQLATGRRSSPSSRRGQTCLRLRVGIFWLSNSGAGGAACPIRPGLIATEKLAQI
ncbi:hypothetical protein BO94DRAFT_535228 [Aspergillus sclerotioniger CBS 115572]|uniref:Uncharacterized protein n=1 Tax=Aspergillus sclerotioniger CBS 115572 TaxID=1450535 RepID=A0A317WKV7_9EURO|nr:hypothetical protein BO94DRAFT_535228 [Aspergillus sclerotioniger CBS 115572]PWY87124.1 hypothetical protein BO94DRAFT_535228 [Aspergillus sclerotioniger CBS 115572]